MRDRDTTEHRGRRRTGAGNGCKPCSGEDTGYCEAARNPADPSLRRAEKGVGQSRMVGDEADQDKHR